MKELIRELFLVGTSFKTAPVALREKAALASTAELREPALEIEPQHGAVELVTLSTCNRTELYFAACAPGSVDEWLEAFGRRHPESPLVAVSSPHVYRRRGGDAARHLFRVACGLDSAVLGDGQILGQIRSAVAASTKRGLIGSYLQKTFALALGVGTRARSETDIGRGSAGMGSALASMLATRHRAPGEAPEVLVLGAGEIASDVARQVAKRAFARLTIANRSREKAQLLAGELGAACSPWDTIDEVLERADVVVAATAATEPVLTLRRVADALRQRHGRPLLVIDLGLPRNVDPNVPCELMDVDAIQDSCRVTLARRQRAIGSVEALVEESLSVWTRFSHSQTAERQIKRLYQAAAEASRTAAAEIARLDGLDSREAEKIVLKTIKRLLHEHARDLRGVTTRSGA